MSYCNYPKRKIYVSSFQTPSSVHSAKSNRETQYIWQILILVLRTLQNQLKICQNDNFQPLVFKPFKSLKYVSPSPFIKRFRLTQFPNLHIHRFQLIKALGGEYALVETLVQSQLFNFSITQFFLGQKMSVSVGPFFDRNQVLSSLAEWVQNPFYHSLRSVNCQFVPFLILQANLTQACCDGAYATAAMSNLSLIRSFIVLPQQETEDLHYWGFH